ncbi:hypothetical protein JIN84_04670 [Luteolibacter yonseiensis]|uniref:Uncharacterized protein n=1 Tax=Luteolibacter yonseiensis TaxID=1144680 RepID=A0A934VAI5_9BACT|nr:hypothetical protein [Luteolibacter yonseiensis]MBK1814896.1 hypothetical protein [Luteolibacter yonseiensis]
MNTQQPIVHSAWNIRRNPIFLRYCQSRLRPQGLGIALLIALLISGFIYFLSRAIALHQGLAPMDAERVTILPLLVFQALILFIMGTALVSGGMTAEKDEGVIDYQRLIPMSPLSKVLGYLFGLPVREHVMVLATLPFTIRALWVGQVEMSSWLPLYTVFFTSALTYHLTGLLTGTVIRNRRWAFLASIGIVTSLYTIVPQVAKFGLVFFKYLTIHPVLAECLPGILPRTAGAIVATGQRIAPTVKFFNLDFPETAFTVFCQGGLILTFIVMLCRRWRKQESLLLGKVWATGFFVWIQLLLLGNALPMIDPGNLFPSRALAGGLFRIVPRATSIDWVPQPSEAVAMSGIYGLVTLLILCVLISIITPGEDIQIRGWRRVRKEGGNSLPILSDAATASGWVILMALAGALGWYVFTQALVESRWFPGHELPLRVLGIFTLVLLSFAVCYHSLLEAKGGKIVGLAVIFIGVVPMMVGAVLSATHERLIPAASWLFGLSPSSGPIYAAIVELSISELPPNLAKSVPRAFYFWQAIAFLTAAWLATQLRAARKAIATKED